jgi:hypothetical protein
MRDDRKERWMELCRQASVEQDREKLLVLVKQINDLLESGTGAGQEKDGNREDGKPDGGKDNVICLVCGKSIAPEIAKTDDDGRAIHEECYLLKHQLRDATGN